MANSKKGTSSTTKKTTTTNKPVTTAAKKPVETSEVKVAPVVAETKVAPPKRLRIADVDLNELVEVKSCVCGTLFYESRDGFTVTWSDFGDVQVMTIGELLKMRNQQLSFFSNNWILLCGDNADDVVNFLQVEKYYNSMLAVDDFDYLFDEDPEEIYETVKKMNDNFKEVVARRAFALIASGELDSRKVVSAIEKATGFDFEE